MRGAVVPGVRALVWAGLLLALPFLVASGGCSGGGGSGPDQAVTAAPGRAGLRVALDARGNRVTPPPVETGQAPQTPQSVEGLAEQSAAVPGGGYGVHLNGRFRSAVTATVDASGRASVTCNQVAVEPVAAPAGRGQE